MQIMPHTGFIYQSDLVQKLPSDLRRKVSRLVAGKVTLAARIDSFHESRDGRQGDELRAEVEHRIEKLQEPPPVKQIKPLVAPIEQARKKRGGRRARKMKERLGITEMRKQANRMTFGEIEEDAYQDDLSFSTGQIGKGGTGRIRAAQVDSKTKARISKTLQKTVQKHNQWGGTTTVRKQVSGTASSVAFTPLQGLEIVNPNAVETKGTETNKYFSSSGFSKVNGAASVQPK
jgi:U4/U6 small nuclear ribonucleoprotein PRP31